MKKLLALVLSVIMAASLAVPAFAAPAPEAGSIGVIGGADGPTAILISGALNGSGMGYGQLTQELIDQMKEFLGGMPHEIGVMVNGEYVQFPDAVPELKDGCLMAPIRALAGVLGGQVAYGEEEAEQLVKAEDKTYLTFSVGNPRVIVEYSSGSGELVTLSCAPYIKNGRAYVPVRFMGEVLGYEVGWDSQFQTAILLDRDALAAEIDKDFTIFNRVQAAAAPSVEEGKSCRDEVEGSVTVTVFDTLNGDKTYKANLFGETLLNTQAASGTYSVTLPDDTVDALMGLLAGADWAGTDEDADTLRTVLEGLSLDIIITNEGSVYVHAPVADELSGEKNLWYHSSMGAELAQAVFAGTGTMGSVLAAMVETDSVESWVVVNEMVRQMAAVYGDGNFTTAGGVSTLTIDADTLDPTGELGIKDAFQEYQITIKVDGEGGVTVSCLMETAAQAGVPGVSVSMQSAQADGKASVDMSIHVSNVGELKLELTATRQAADEQPMAEPPAGANITSAQPLET